MLRKQTSAGAEKRLKTEQKRHVHSLANSREGVAGGHVHDALGAKACAYDHAALQLRGHRADNLGAPA